MSYVSGDFGDAATYERVASAIGDAQCPVFYLEIPPFLFGRVIKGLTEAGLTKTGRVVVEKPFGHDLESARELAAEIHQYIDESQLYRIDHFLGKMGLGEILYLRFANSMLRADLEPQLRRARRDHDGRELRRRGSRPFLRSGRRAARRGRQPPDAGASPPRRWSRPSGDDAGTLKDAMFAVFRAMPEADPAHYVRGQYDGYRSIDGVATGLDHRDVRRDAARDRQLALGRRAVVHPHREAPAGHADRGAARVPAARRGCGSSRRVGGRRARVSWWSSSTRSTGIRLLVEAQRADTGEPEEITLDMEFAQEGGEGPTPYEVLLHAALVGDSTRFTRQDGVEECWRVMAPLLEHPPPVHPYAQGVVGARGGRSSCSAGYGRWHGPWVAS